MLKPSYLEQLPEPLVELVSELENEITADIAARVVKGKYNTPSSEWLMYKANQLRMSSQSVNKMIAKKAKTTEKTVREIYTEAVTAAIKEDMQVYEYAEKDNIISKSEGAKLNTYFRSIAFNDIFRKGLQNTNRLMKNLTNSMAKASGNALIHAMDLAWLETASGAYTPDEAVYKAVKSLAEKGITVVTYEKSGDKISSRRDQVDVAVRRAVRTSINKTCCDMQLDLAGEMGCDLVEVTSHFGARPTHADWQGQVYSLSGKHPKYKAFSVTGYGRGDGLGGWNCRHSFYPYFEGLSERASIPNFTAAENEEYYKLTQRQRALERDIRKSKRELAITDRARQNAQLDDWKAKWDRDFAKQSETLKRREKRLADFCRENNLYPDGSRTRVVGFGKSISQRAVHAAKKSANSFLYRGNNYTLSDGATVFKRLGSEISARKISGANNALYISDNVPNNGKGQLIRRADQYIGKAIQKMGLTGKADLPEFVIVSESDMNCPGSYNIVTNKLYLNAGIFDGRTRSSVQGEGVCPNSKISTIVHELFHWQDTEEYRQKYGNISSGEDCRKYDNYLNAKCKKELDNLGVSRYNVDKISAYARKMLFTGKYFETYTEYRTLRKLGG